MEALTKYITVDAAMLGNLLQDWGLKILFALLIFIVGRWVAKTVSRLSGRALRRTNVDFTLVHFITTIINITITVLVAVMAMQQLGVPMTSLIAVLGAAGLAIGLALKDSLSNFASGVLLMTMRPFKAGDFVEMAGVSGIVDSVGILHSKIYTVQNQEIIIPNANITLANIVNYSSRPTRRIDIVVGISYSDDIARARNVIADTIKADERLHRDPAPIIHVDQFADSSINIIIRVWTNTDIFWDVRSDLHQNIKGAFDREGITIPFPQREVRHYPSLPIEPAR